MKTGEAIRILTHRKIMLELAAGSKGARELMDREILALEKAIESLEKEIS